MDIMVNKLCFIFVHHQHLNFGHIPDELFFFGKVRKREKFTPRVALSFQQVAV